MQVINGKEIAENLQNKLMQQLSILAFPPKLVVILIGKNKASHIYVRNKKKKAEKIGVISSVISLPSSTTQNELTRIIKKLNDDKGVHGILVQLPLPPHIDQFLITNTIDPNKDVDCFHSENVGNLVIGKQHFIPCTPYGCLYLIKYVLGKDLSGLDALIVGRSNIVGKPMSQLLLQENCTVTIAHSRTKDIDQKCRQADIIVAAVGKPHLIKHAKKGATVIDVGINSFEGKLVGDVDFNSVSQVAGAITPVPGGVGPMTITFLLANTILAACKQSGIKYTVEELLS